MKKILFLITAGLFLAGCTLVNQSGSINSGNNQSSNENSQILSSNKLDLSGRQLKSVPQYVFDMANLEELDVSNNRLTGALPAEIRHLQNLKILNASNNQMTGVPAEVGQLQKLQVLDLSNNQLTGLPYELGNLKNLKTLNIAGNQYSEQDLAIIKKGLPANVNIIK